MDCYNSKNSFNLKSLNNLSIFLVKKSFQKFENLFAHNCVIKYKE